MRVLIVSPYLPHAAVGHGGGISTYHFARQLARRHEVELLCFCRNGEVERSQDLESHGVRVQSIHLASPRDPLWRRPSLWLDRSANAILSCLRREPPMVGKYRRRRMTRALVRALARFQPDVVQVEFSWLAEYAAAARSWRGVQARPVVGLNSHEAALLPRQRRLERARGVARWQRRVDLWLWTQHERRAIVAADWLQCVSDPDLQCYRQLGADPQRLWHQPLGVDPERLGAAAAPNPTAPRLLFVGSFDHEPNRAAARCLATQIFPELARRHERLSLDIVGPRPPAWLRRLAAPRLRVHGFAPDLDPLYDGTSAFVAPLFLGGGIKIKILEALARGAPVVTTSIGIEGIQAHAERELLLADDVASCIEQTDRLLCDPRLARELGARARTQILERYGWPTLVDGFERQVQSRWGESA